MKKVFLISAALFALTYGLCAQQMQLGEAFIRAARDVEAALPQNAVTAALNFVSPSETFSAYAAGELSGELVRGQKLTVLDAQSQTQSGGVSDFSAREIGGALGAEFIISGALTSMGTYYRFMIRVINVETGAIRTQFSLDLQKDEQIAFLLENSTPQSPSSNPPASSGSTAAASPGSRATPLYPANPSFNRSGGTIWAPNRPKKNWISIEGGIIGAGLRYEGRVNPYISLGANLNWSMSYIGNDTYNLFGLNFSFRCFPGGKSFFIGTGLGGSMGYHNYSKTERVPHYNYYNNTYTYYEEHVHLNSDFIVGMELLPLEIGWKIDFGSPGGFFMEPAFAFPLSLSGGFYPRWYFAHLGFGVAF